MTKKLIYLLVILIVLEIILGTIYLKKKPSLKTSTAPAEKTSGAKLYFSPLSQKLKVNETAQIKILINTNGRMLTGADSVIKYDPETIEIIGDPLPGKIFPAYPINKVKIEKGIIKITGTITSPDQPIFSGIGEFAVLTIKALKAKETSLTFEFSPEKSNESNLAEKETSKDILSEVSNLKIIINQ